jgi:hypothetical protein
MAAGELDDVFEALCDRRRRLLLAALLTGRGERPLPALATELVARERGKPAGDVTDAERRRVHASLYHRHLPKLADLGFVDYRTGGVIIVRACDVERVRPFLELAGAPLEA